MFTPIHNPAPPMHPHLLLQWGRELAKTRKRRSDKPKSTTLALLINFLELEDKGLGIVLHSLLGLRLELFQVFLRSSRT